MRHRTDATASGRQKDPEDEMDTRDRSVDGVESNSSGEEDGSGGRRRKLLDKPKPWSKPNKLASKKNHLQQQEEQQTETPGLSPPSNTVLSVPRQSSFRKDQHQLLLPTGDPSDHASESANFENEEPPDDLVNFNDLWNASSKSSIPVLNDSSSRPGAFNSELWNASSKSSLHYQQEDSNNNASKSSLYHQQEDKNNACSKSSLHHQQQETINDKPDESSNNSCASSPSNEDEDIFVNWGGSFRRDDSESVLDSSKKDAHTVKEKSGVDNGEVRGSSPVGRRRANSREEEQKCPSPVIDSQENGLSERNYESQNSPDSPVQAAKEVASKNSVPSVDTSLPQPVPSAQNKSSGEPPHRQWELEENANAPKLHQNLSRARASGVELEPSRNPPRQRQQPHIRQKPQKSQPTLSTGSANSVRRYDVHSSHMDTSVMLNSLRKQLGVLKALDQQRINAVNSLNKAHQREADILRLHQHEQMTHSRDTSPEPVDGTNAPSVPQHQQRDIPAAALVNDIAKDSLEAFDDEHDVKSLKMKKRQLEEIHKLKKEHAEQLDALRRQHLEDVGALEEQLEQFHSQQRDELRSDDGESLPSESMRSESARSEIAFLHQQLDEMRQKYQDAVAAKDGITVLENPSVLETRDTQPGEQHGDELASLKAQLEKIRKSEQDAVAGKERLQNELAQQFKELDTLEQQLSETQDNLNRALGDREDKVASVEKKEADELTHIKFELEQARSSQLHAVSASKDLRSVVHQKKMEISELQEEIEEKKSAFTQLENKLEIVKDDLRIKAERHSDLEDEMEELRQKLTKANVQIEHLEEERSYSQAKLSEYASFMDKKGGISPAESQLLERASEISQLNSKLSNLNQSLLERDDKIFKLEEETEATSALVLQLSDMFVEGHPELETQQKLLIDSAGSASQANTLLLMRMMNMLETLKSESDQLRHDRDQSAAKASKYKAQLKEGRTKFNQLKSELIQLQQQAAGDEAQLDHNSSSGRASPPPESFPTSSAVAVSPDAAQGQPESPTQKRSRFMTFIKTNLNQEQAG